MGVDISGVSGRKRMTLLDVLFKESETQKKRPADKVKLPKRDTLTLSGEAKRLEEAQKIIKPSLDTRLDQTIDLEGYFEEARKANQQAIAAAGDEIDLQAKPYFISASDVYHKALLEKYEKLVQEAKGYPDPKEYIAQKYERRYAADLSREECSIAYRNVMLVLSGGTDVRISSSDSFFREQHPIHDGTAGREFERQLVNAQIGNILKKNGIELAKDQKMTFTVDPYSYLISVQGVDDTLKNQVESALNTGNNGKNLFFHISHSTAHDEITSTQKTREGSRKRMVFHDTLTTLGLDIRQLTERNGTYYTDTGEDVITLYCESVNKMDKPDWIKNAMKLSYAELVNQISAKGWNNMPDMYLRIDYSQEGLCDKLQNHGFGATSREWLESKLQALGPFSTM